MFQTYFTLKRICKGKKITYKFYSCQLEQKSFRRSVRMEIQIQIVELLKRVLKGDVLWTFFPAGEAGGGRGGKVRCASQSACGSPTRLARSTIFTQGPALRDGSKDKDWASLNITTADAFFVGGSRDFCCRRAVN